MRRRQAQVPVASARLASAAALVPVSGTAVISPPKFSIIPEASVSVCVAPAAAFPVENRFDPIS